MVLLEKNRSRGLIQVGSLQMPPLRRELLHRDLKNDEKGTAMPNQKECRSTTENSMCEDSLWRKSYQRSSQVQLELRIKGVELGRQARTMLVTGIQCAEVSKYSPQKFPRGGLSPPEMEYSEGPFCFPCHTCHIEQGSLYLGFKKLEWKIGNIDLIYSLFTLKCINSSFICERYELFVSKGPFYMQMEYFKQ